MVILPKSVRLAISDRLRRRSSQSGFVGDAIAQNAKAIDFHLDDIAGLQPQRRGSP
jgi:hypothetical protein